MDKINTLVLPNAKAIACFVVAFITGEIAKRGGVPIPEDVTVALSALITAVIVWWVSNKPAAPTPPTA